MDCILHRHACSFYSWICIRFSGNNIYRHSNRWPSYLRRVIRSKLGNHNGCDKFANIIFNASFWLCTLLLERCCTIACYYPSNLSRGSTICYHSVSWIGIARVIPTSCNDSPRFTEIKFSTFGASYNWVLIRKLEQLIPNTNLMTNLKLFETKQDKSAK